MSTRCQIAFVDKEGELYPVKIYMHCDGYPEGVMPTLAPYVKSFAAGRGEDQEYLVAQTLGAFSRAMPDYGPGAPGRFTGWGLSTFWHSDIAYLYVVSSDGTVKILDPDISDDLADDVLPSGSEVTWEEEKSSSGVLAAADRRPAVTACTCDVFGGVHAPSCPCSDETIGFFPQEPPPGSPEAVERAATYASERAKLVAVVGECCRGTDPLCAGGCLVERALLASSGSPAAAETIRGFVDDPRGAPQPDSNGKPVVVEKHRHRESGEEISFYACGPVRGSLSEAKADAGVFGSAPLSEENNRLRGKLLLADLKAEVWIGGKGQERLAPVPVFVGDVQKDVKGCERVRLQIGASAADLTRNQLGLLIQNLLPLFKAMQEWPDVEVRRG